MMEWKLTLQAEHLADLPSRLETGLGKLISENPAGWKVSLEADQNSPLFRPPTVTRNQLEKWLVQGWIHLNGTPLNTLNIKSNALRSHLRVGDTLTVSLPKPRALDLVPENRPLNILYEDDELLILNKPPGLTVHPSETQTDNTLVHALLGKIGQLSGIGGVQRPGIVHRIDKDTSGTLVITKSDLAHQKLSALFSEHKIERVYWALCYGSPPLQECRPNGPWKRIESLLDRSPQDRKKMSMHVQSGRKAITHYRCVAAYGQKKGGTLQRFASLMELRLETGRTHQIRVHLTNEGYSLLGDPIYGSPTPQQSKWKLLPRSVQELVEKLPGQALHARTLGFVHPTQPLTLTAHALPPPPWMLLWNKLKKFTL
jgi:23S rRNA pseudouridine1911/1915/1917 synthase